ncbi:MAG: hypothetical protein JHC33_05540 [Ignisphaera sp.]|nr:hypothetical protein [Ignisphaera sp.]
MAHQQTVKCKNKAYLTPTQQTTYIDAEPSKQSTSMRGIENNEFPHNSVNVVVKCLLMYLNDELDFF